MSGWSNAKRERQQAHRRFPRRRLKPPPNSKYDCREHGRVKAIVRRINVKGRGAGGSDYVSWRLWCLYCQRLNQKTWALTNRARNRARSLAWYAANRERKLAYQKSYYEANIDRIKAYDRLRGRGRSLRSESRNQVGNVLAQAQARTSLSGMTGPLAPLL